MALTFALYTDTAGSSAFSGTLQLTHYTDQSDNPQDTTLYYMSTTAGRTLEATSNPGVDNVTLTPVDTATEWTSGASKSLGDRVFPVTPNGYVYKATTAGTTGSSEPTWPTSGIGSTVADGTVVWTLVAAYHPPTEIKLATSASGLSSATAGAALNLGATLTSGVANQIEVHVRVTNTVTTVDNSIGFAQIGVQLNAVQEAEA